MKNVPRKTIKRALVYIRTLQSLIERDQQYISSSKLAKIVGFNDAQIRKDISNFGRVGIPRLGYNVKELLETLEDFVLKKEAVRVVLVGVGNLGTALLRYPWKGKGNIVIVAAFDNDSAKIGTRVNGVVIDDILSFKKKVKTLHIDLAIIAVPEEVSQKVADMIVDADIPGIINFSPVSIQVPSYVAVKSIDLSITFLSAYFDSIMARK